MCGIAGFVDPVGGEMAARRKVQQMLRSLAHRGEDGSGIRSSCSSAIGMCRLRIRSERDAKVPFDLPRRLSGALNGEVYTSSTTTHGKSPSGGAGEVAAVLGSDDGVDGMFALAVIDREGSIRLMRDRYGIKPLFLRDDNRCVSFASELAALLKVAGPVDIDRSAVHEILAFGRTFDRRTIYAGISEVRPGWELNISSDGNIDSTRSIADCAQVGNTEGGIFDMILKSVERAADADRSRGIAVSGGLDSAILAFAASEIGMQDINTASLVVPDNGDGIGSLGGVLSREKVARGGWRHEFDVYEAEDYFLELAKCARRMGEPFRMSSLPMYYRLGELARRRGTRVLLLGEGADELFGGYDSYMRWERDGLSLSDDIAGFYLGRDGGRLLRDMLGDDVVGGLKDRFRAAIRPWIDGLSPCQSLLAVERRLSLEPLLRRADHALMASGIEGRVPFLHGGIPGIAAELPDSELWTPTQNKIALRRSFLEKLPLSIVMGAKRPFRAPTRFFDGIGRQVIRVVFDAASSLFNALGISHAGACELIDVPFAHRARAIPIVVGLLSLAFCVSNLAIAGGLRDPFLSDAGCAAAEVIETSLKSASPGR